MSAPTAVRFRIEKMDCSGCVATLERALCKLDGVGEVSGSAVARTLSVELDPTRIGVEGVKDEIGRAGYVAELVQGRRSTEAPTSTWWSGQAKVAYASLGLFLISGVVRLVEPTLGGALLGGRGLAGVLLVASAFVGGWNFFPKGFRAARSLRLDMNFLMTVAIFGALAIGEFMEAAAIAFLFAIAELLESYAVDRARASVASLMSLTPDEATVLRDGRETRVRADEVQVEEVVVVRAGERIPVDGLVVHGVSSVDQSSITGEPLPADKAEGDQVFAGTVNEEGMLRIRTTGASSSTTLARIVQLLEEAEATKPKSERFVQRFARVYTPAVTILALAIATLPALLLGEPFTPWFVRGLTLLVIACPCAFIISTPVTVVSGVTAAARNGVLIKGGLYLEALAEIGSIAFDKTGTLTIGHPEVVSIVSESGRDQDEVLSIAAAVEAGSRHPIARAIVDAANRRGSGRYTAAAQNFKSLTGEGVTGTVDGVEYFIGKPSRDIEATGEGGALSVVEIRTDLQPVGRIILSDRIRPEALPAVRALRSGGIGHIAMLTGDQASSADSVARGMEIDDVRAGLLPEDKMEAVRSLAAERGGVAMVGDGVNDGPALAAATVGIAMGVAGSDTALEVADVALIGDDLSRLPYLFELSRRSRRIIRQNIVIALGVKLILVAAVPFGVVSLIAAVVIGDMGVSLAVTGNALRLGRFQAVPGP